MWTGGQLASFDMTGVITYLETPAGSNTYQRDASFYQWLRRSTNIVCEGDDTKVIYIAATTTGKLRESSVHVSVC